jgi:hypothetical protein
MAAVTLFHKLWYMLVCLMVWPNFKRVSLATFGPLIKILLLVFDHGVANLVADSCGPVVGCDFWHQPLPEHGH